MSRFIRNTVILAKVEATYGVDSAPTGAANAMLVSGLSITPLNAQNVARDLVRGFMGGSEQLVGNRFVECGFTIELIGNGTSGAALTVPAWSDVLRSCGFAVTLSIAAGAERVDFTPVSAAFTSVSIHWFDDGLLHKLLGARGTVTFKLGAGGRPEMAFSFKGLYSAPTVVANAVPTLTAFKTPLIVNEANTADLTFGATHAVAAAPALTAGTAYPSLGLEIMAGNTVEYVPLLGGESVEITNRDVSASFQLFLNATQEAAFHADVAAATLTSVGLVHGSTAGLRALVFMPFVQRINPSKQEQSGKRMVGFDGRVTPSLGNDEMRLVLW